LARANDALWTAIAERLRASGLEAPDQLTRDRPLDDVWLDPSLLVAQTCGYPFVTRLAGRVRLVATPSYDAEGCAGPFHRSAIVVRRDDRATSLADLFGRRCVINSPDSNTGMNLLRAAVAPLARQGRFFGEISVSGAHSASAEAIAAGEADVAGIDAVTWEHLRRFRPALTDRLRVLSWTAASPGLPLISAWTTSQANLKLLRRALFDVAADTTLREARSALRLTGFCLLPRSRYRAIGQPIATPVADQLDRTSARSPGNTRPTLASR
jgi:ABC-type phosphate/phosphonate transport system substrate-binding protein